MGAIYGLVNIGNADVLKAMGDRLAHRGRGRWEWQADENVWLGCIDHVATSGSQDAAGEPGLACDGDIFVAENPQPNSSLPAAASAIQRRFDEHGIECLSELHGYFALACWDKSEKTLLLASDMLGSRPIYYWKNNDLIAFASEYKALLCVPGIDVSPNLEAIQYLQGRKTVPPGESLVENIRSVLPGSVFEFSGTRLRQRTWFQPRLDVRNFSETRHADELRKNFKRALSEQTAGRDAGVSLSGGVDSNCIVSAFKELYPEKPLHTFTTGSSTDDEDVRAARDVAEFYGTAHHEIIFGAEEIERHLPTVIWHLEDPIARSETLQYYLLAREAREFVDVLLSGQIADGLYAGMPRYKVFPSLRLAPFLRKPLSEFYAYTQAGVDAKTRVGALIQKVYFGDSIPPVPSVIGASGDAELAELPQGREALNETLLESVNTSIPQWFAKVDRSNFAHGIAVFSPFIDRQLIDQAFQIPSAMKIRRFREKHILRRALAPLLPREFLRRPKFAQRMTYDDRFSDLLQDYARRILTPERIRKRGLFEPGEISRLLDRAGGKAYSAEHGMRIWTALCTELWASLFIDRKGARPDASIG